MATSATEGDPAKHANIRLDSRLVEHALRLGKHRTRREAVTEALEEHMRHRERLRILELEGTIDFDLSYDHRKERWRGMKRIPRGDPS